jgi:hypothetical protein
MPLQSSAGEAHRALSAPEKKVPPLTPPHSERGTLGRLWQPDRPDLHASTAECRGAASRADRRLGARSPSVYTVLIAAGLYLLNNRGTQAERGWRRSLGGRADPVAAGGTGR